jgi:hypothetical protein
LLVASNMNSWQDWWDVKLKRNLDLIAAITSKKIAIV